MAEMQCQRVEPVIKDGREWLPQGEGNYCKDANGVWWFHALGAKSSAALNDHTITEHEDGTITVMPSILWPKGVNSDTGKDIHGFLTRGVWKDC